ncbi:MAG: transcription elongation factor 1 family protein [Candidatus Hodarchaeales archaeon]|jgi:transcription elongation factor Elf1
MGRKRKRIVRTKPIPTVPTVFDCPICGASNAIHIELNRQIRTAIIRCGRCKVQATRPVRTIEEQVDVFGDWLDELLEETESIPSADSQ